MRIVQVIHMFLDGGGREEHVLQVSKYLAQKGHKITIITSDYTPTGEYYLQQKAEQIPGIKIITLKGYLTNIPPGRVQIPDLLEFLLKYPADIVHAHGMGEQPPQDSFYAAKIKNIPFVYTLHFAPYTAYRNLKAEQIWKVFQQYQTYTLLRGADKVVCVSPQEKQDIMTYTTYKGNNFTVIPNGFEKAPTEITNEFIKQTYEKYEIPEGRKYVVFLGPLTNPRKGALEAIQAFRKAWSKDEKLHFLIIGRWESRISMTGRTSNIVSVIGKLGKARHVTFMGRVEDAEKYALMHGADMLIAPTTYEAFGIALCEALYCKIPVIATDIGGCRYVVRNNVDGILIPNQTDVQAFADAILDLSKNPEKAKAMGESGHKRVTKLFSWEKTGESLEQVYQELFKQYKKND